MKKEIIKTIIIVPICIVGILILLGNKTISNKPSELVDPSSREEAERVLTYPEEANETTESIEE